jgi:hypothetical protein
MRSVLLCITLLLSSHNSFCQKSGQESDPTTTSGHFEIAMVNAERHRTEHINVNYSLSPAPFTNNIVIELSTPQPTSFRADIVTAGGAKVIHWKPAVKNYHYRDDIDISRLAPGTYFVNIYSEDYPGLLHSISFKKAK